MTRSAARSLRVTHRRVLGLLALALGFRFAAADAQADLPESVKKEVGVPSLPTVTVEARRDREELQRQIDTYVSATIVHPFDESLSRWDTPICPLVAGLPRDRGDFILTRLSAIVSEAGAPLDNKQGCHANFFVIVTATPDLLLKKWRARDPGMFNTDRGAGGIDRFLSSSRTVRIWYNVNWGGASDGSALSIVGGVGSANSINSVPTMSHYDGGTRLKWSGVRHIQSVIVVVDAARLQDVRIGQLADYIGMVGLADVRLDADYGSAPTILRLFADSQAVRPDGLSPWDEALLKALYTTDQESQMQLSEMRTSVMKTLSP